MGRVEIIIPVPRLVRHITALTKYHAVLLSGDFVLKSSCEWFTSGPVHHLVSMTE